MPPAISSMRFPFELKKDQIEAAKAWIDNGRRGSVIFSTGTGKTEIAFECARCGSRTVRTGSLYDIVPSSKDSVDRAKH